MDGHNLCEIRWCLYKSCLERNVLTDRVVESVTLYTTYPVFMRTNEGGSGTGKSQAVQIKVILSILCW